MPCLLLHAAARNSLLLFLDNIARHFVAADHLPTQRKHDKNADCETIIEVFNMISHSDISPSKQCSRHYHTSNTISLPFMLRHYSIDLECRWYLLTDAFHSVASEQRPSRTFIERDRSSQTGSFDGNMKKFNVAPINDHSIKRKFIELLFELIVDIKHRALWWPASLCQTKI